MNSECQANRIIQILENYSKILEEKVAQAKRGAGLSQSQTVADDVTDSGGDLKHV